ncbi:MAG: hypothetical protein ABIP39_16130 [Polyangiaceae bacterium]
MRPRVVVELIVVALGLAVLAWVYCADLGWFERHWFPYAYSWVWDAADLKTARSWRIFGAVVGALLLFVVRPLLGRWAGRHTRAEVTDSVVRIGLSVVAALVSSEICLRALGLPKKPDKAQWVEVKIGEPDARYGWRYVGSHSTKMWQGGRDVEYAINAEHCRARSIDAVPDPALPTLIFTGESVTAGHGLRYEETFPALVGDAVKLQVVNLAVHGYGSDQAFLRLAENLPRFQHPVAVVTFFIPAMLWRLSDNDHPHLGFDGPLPKVVPLGFWTDLRIEKIWKNVIPYRNELALEAKIVRETARLAEERGAKAIFVAPRFNDQNPREDAYLVEQLFVQQGLTVVDTSFGYQSIAYDNHPDAASERRLADAVLVTLRTQLALKAP